jgi:hypothetical protein
VHGERVGVRDGRRGARVDRGDGGRAAGVDGRDGGGRRIGLTAVAVGSVVVAAGAIVGVTVDASVGVASAAAGAAAAAAAGADAEARICAKSTFEELAFDASVAAVEAGRPASCSAAACSASARAWISDIRETASAYDTALEDDAGGQLGVAAPVDQVDRDVEVAAAARDQLGDGERLAGVDQHLEAPAFDPRLGALDDGLDLVFDGEFAHRSCDR